MFLSSSFVIYYPPGFSATDSSFINSDYPHLTIGKDDILNQQQEETPHIISLNCCLMGEEISDKSPIISYHENDKSFKPCLIYSPKDELSLHGQYKSISVIYKGNGYYHSSNAQEKIPFFGKIIKNKELLLDDLLYKQTFITQTTNLNSHSKKENPSHWLFGYGGFFHLGCPLEKIEQIIFSTVSSKDSTKINHTRLSSWQKEGLHPKPLKQQAGFAHKHKVYFYNDFEPPQLLNLASVIEQGFIKLHVSLGILPTGEKLISTYQSFSYNQKDFHKNFIDILFKKGGDDEYYFTSC